MEFRHPPGLARTFPHQMRVTPRADVGVDLPELRAPRIHRQPEDVRRDHPEAAIGDEPIGSPLAVARGLPLEPLPACLGCLGHWRTLRPGARSHGVTRSHRGLSPGHGPRVRNDRLRTGQTWRVRACARGACDLGHAPAPAYDGLLASGYGRGMPMHTEPGRACRRRTASCSLPSAIECAACPPQGRWWATDDGCGLGASMKLSCTAVGATAGPSSRPSCETPAPCQASLITSAHRSAARSLGRGRPCDDVRRRRGPSRSADAVALVPAEQQCDETLRGGRTQFDVDGAVTGHRF